MARQYIVTEEEMLSLVDQLKLHSLTRDNIYEPNQPPLTEEDYKKLRWAIDSLHRSFHYVVVRWLQDAVGFHSLRDCAHK